MSKNVFWYTGAVTRGRREQQNGHRGTAVWFTGLSASGKSTLAHAAEHRLHAMGCNAYVLDGDNVRHGLCADLGFSPADRHENLRRIGELTRLFVDAGIIALAAFISPYRVDRDRIRERIGTNDFVEVYCRCPIEVCESRDPKEVYRKARDGEIADFTGVSAPYEAPVAADLVIDTDKTSIGASVDLVLSLLQNRRVIASWDPRHEEPSKHPAD